MSIHQSVSSCWLQQLQQQQLDDGGDVLVIFFYISNQILNFKYYRLPQN